MGLVEDLLTFSEARAVAVWVPRPADPTTLVIAYQVGLPDAYVAFGNQLTKLPEAKAKAPVYQSFREGIEVTVPRPSASDRLPFGDWYEVLGLSEILTCPLAADGEVVGVLALYYPDPTSSAFRFKRRHADFARRCTALARGIRALDAAHASEGDAALEEPRP